jgi:aryl-alcohol dehydrogenase-like predicted oxidoreductase
MSKAEAAAPLAVVPFGRTGRHITRVGLGSWAVGGVSGGIGWGQQDDEDSIKTIRAAIEHSGAGSGPLIN